MCVCVCVSSSQAAFTCFSDSFSSFVPMVHNFPAVVPEHSLCPHRAVVGNFLLFGQHGHLHLKGATGKRYL